jgi:multiple sugar transport system permease protein
MQFLKKRRFQEDYLPGYLFLLPALIFFGFFVAYPMVKGIILSFYHYTQTSYYFAGFDNYITLIKDRNFGIAVINTILFVVGNVPLVVIFSLFVSVVLYRRSEITRSFYRAAFYLPAVSSIVTISLVWQYIFNPPYGLLNYLLKIVGMKPSQWLGDPNMALGCLLVILLTLSVGQPIILYIAALGNIPSEYLEVADLEGASAWDKFKNIYWPLILPTTLYIVVITTINSFQTFAIVQLLTGGGPFYHTTTILFQLYSSAFEFQEFGIASAMGIILALIVVFISVIQFKFFSTDVEY